MVIVFSLVALWVTTAAFAAIAFGRTLAAADATAPAHEQITPGAARQDWESARRAAPALTARIASRLAAPARARSLSS